MSTQRKHEVERPYPHPQSWEVLFQRLEQAVEGEFFQRIDDYAPGPQFFQGCVALYQQAEQLNSLSTDDPQMRSHDPRSWFRAPLDANGEESDDEFGFLSDPTNPQAHPSAYFPQQEIKDKMYLVYGVDEAQNLPGVTLLPDNLLVTWNSIIRGATAPHSPGFRFSSKRFKARPALHHPPAEGQFHQDLGGMIVFSLEYALSGSKKGPLGRSVGEKNQVWSWDLARLSPGREFSFGEDQSVSGAFIKIELLKPPSDFPPGVAKKIQQLITSHAQLGFPTVRSIKVENRQGAVKEVPNPMQAWTELAPTAEFFDHDPFLKSQRYKLGQAVTYFRKETPLGSMEPSPDRMLKALQVVRQVSHNLKEAFGVDKKTPEGLRWFEPADLLFDVTRKWEHFFARGIEYVQYWPHTFKLNPHDFFLDWWSDGLEIWARMAGDHFTEDPNRFR